MSDDGAVRVFVRVRPFVERELKEEQKPCFRFNTSARTVAALDTKTFSRERESFSFDGVLWSFGDPSSPDFASQRHVFENIGIPMIDNIFRGYNACVFAYGQTGSGKTHTMMGNLGDREEEGLIPRICAEIFRRAVGQDYLIEATYIEIYNETVLDLLTPGAKDRELRVRQHPTTGPFVEGLTPVEVRDTKEVMDVVALGNQERTTAATKMNDRSSRSHAILSLTVTEHTMVMSGSQEVRSRGKFSRVYMVDLAGSERVIDSGSVGQNFVEATSINLSLVTLGRCITTLADVSQARKAGRRSLMKPPYRESMLTWILSEAIGGNSRTFMVANVSPSVLNFDQSINTLRYASRAREVVNQAVVNEDPLLQQLRALQEQVAKQTDPAYIKKLEEKVTMMTEQLKLEAANRVRSANLSERVNELENERRELLKKYETTQSELLRIKSQPVLPAARSGSPTPNAHGATAQHQVIELERERRELENKLAQERAKHMSALKALEVASQQRLDGVLQEKESSTRDLHRVVSDLQRSNESLNLRLADAADKLMKMSSEAGTRADTEAMQKHMNNELRQQVTLLGERLESMKSKADELIQLRSEINRLQEMLSAKDAEVNELN
eukprot:PhF_6_TR25537/c1_g1_i1/m.35818/K17914/KIF13; kinesin family member 13